MESHRIKSIIIVILIVINGFLLVLVGARRSEARRYEQSALEGSIQVLARNGIELNTDDILGRTGYESGATQRDLTLESQMASALLGEQAEGSSHGGGLYIYSTRYGQLSFRNGGELSSQLEYDPYWQTADPESYSETLVERLGLEMRRISYDVLGGNGQVVYQQLVDGAPLFSCRLVMTYEDGCLTELSGNLLAMGERSKEGDELLSLPTILMHFLDEVLNSGDVCSSVTQVEPGYLMTQSFSTTITLQPVWYISTNTADYYVNGITGDLSRVLD